MRSKGNCAVCGEEIEGEICCSSYECPCQGRIEFPFCSEACFDIYMKPSENLRIDKTTLKMKSKEEEIKALIGPPAPKSVSLLNRKGRLVVPRSLITDALEVRPGIVKALFSRFFPTYSETVGFYPGEVIVFYGYSEDFEEVPEGVIAPDYQATVTDKSLNKKAGPVWCVGFEKILK